MGGFRGGRASRTHGAGPDEFRQRDTARPGRLVLHVTLLRQEADSHQGGALPGLRARPPVVFRGGLFPVSWRCASLFRAGFPRTASDHARAHGGITAPACRGGYTAICATIRLKRRFWSGAAARSQINLASP